MKYRISIKNPTISEGAGRDFAFVDGVTNEGTFRCFYINNEDLHKIKEDITQTYYCKKGLIVEVFDL